jgi:transcriptional regulator with XRE-family HTH domain
MARVDKTQEGNPLKEIRTFLGLTQSAFGHLLGGVDGTSVSRRERSKSAAMSWEEIVRLDEALKQHGMRFSDFSLREADQ